MTVLVNDNGFHKDSWESDGGFFIDLEKFGQDVADKDPQNTALDIPNDTNVESLKGLFESVAMIRISFPGFSDGRGFSVARKLRQLGYRGKLRAQGHVIADQYAHARNCGFDEVEIDEALSLRQPEEQWLSRLPNADGSYQERLLGPGEPSQPERKNS